MRARHQTGEGGFTLVEVMVAMLLLAIALTGLAQLVGSQMVDSLRTRVRQVTVSYVNQELESLRSMTYTRLAMDPSDGTVPTSKTAGGNTYNVVNGTSGCGGTTCLTYSKTVNLTNNQVSGNNFTFTETRWVGQISGAAYKTVFVSLTSTSGPSFTYNSQTDVSGATTNNPTAVTALEIDLQQVDTSGTVVTDPTTGLAEVPPDGFTVTVMSGSTTISSGSETDGSYSVTSGLSPSSSYTCTVSNPGGTGLSTWLPYATPADTSFSCNTGAAGTTTQVTSHWKQAGCTATGGTGSLTATVFNSSGALVSGVTVKLTAVQGQGNPSPQSVNSNASGVSQFNTVNAGLFTIALSGGGSGLSNKQNNFDSVCIWSGQTTDVTLFDLAGPPNPPAGSANADLTLPVKNTYPAGTATLAVEVVDTTNTYKFETQVDLDGCGSTCPTPTTVQNGLVTIPVFTKFSYTVTVNCVGVGGADPPGTTDGPTVEDGEPLSTWSTGNVTGNLAGSTTSVKCPQS